MKKLIISGLLLMNALTFSYAQEPATAPVTPAPASAPAPAAAPPAPAPVQQTKEVQTFRIGLKLTPAYCWFSLDQEDVESDGGYVGYSYGIMTDFRIAENYFFSTGVEMSQRGGKYKSDMFDVNDTLVKAKVTQRIQFVDIPFSLKLKTNEIGYTRYYGTFGFLAGFTTKCNQDIDFEDANIEDRDKRDNMSDFGSFNFGLLVGAGLEYKFSGNTAITAGLQYHNAFVDIWSDEGTIKSNYVSLNLGLFF